MQNRLQSLTLLDYWSSFLVWICSLIIYRHHFSRMLWKMNGVTNQIVFVHHALNLYFPFHDLHQLKNTRLIPNLLIVDDLTHHWKEFLKWNKPSQHLLLIVGPLLLLVVGGLLHLLLSFGLLLLLVVGQPLLLLSVRHLHLSSSAGSFCHVEPRQHRLTVLDKCADRVESLLAKMECVLPT